jgi:two-component system, chemotaxis family, sensor kinase Cph1
VLLSEAGFEVAEASNGLEAYEKYKIQPPNLIFLDMNMPVMNGFEFVIKIRLEEKETHLPIIALTASAFDENRNEMLKAGMDDYIRKPFKIQEIFDVLQTFLHVQYVYCDDKVKAEVKIGKVTTESLACIPKNLIRRMHESALKADLDMLLEIIGETAQLSPELSISLREMAKKYRYGELIKLFQERVENE